MLPELLYSGFFQAMDGTLRRLIFSASATLSSTHEVGNR
ncbi:unnamed protein product [Acanthoscelides obtectus]|uniref:Uncharacterized protein n=1 Tax=Acanthoscelides obtectus TaxID=200917 RepID=A0A9P0KG68_ACAOB|nr:unnamed protein product [Acanthoscelides obtectus]CAK1672649.1 hypothetical protein AOBTE_LOCUS29017 [Acanthoscelides obtectus]